MAGAYVVCREVDRRAEFAHQGEEPSLHAFMHDRGVLHPYARRQQSFRRKAGAQQVLYDFHFGRRDVPAEGGEPGRVSVVYQPSHANKFIERE
jgi:hypothetical protein